MGKSIIKNYIYNNILLIFNLAYPLITTIYINKIFSVKLIGELSFSLSIVTIFISLSSLGIEAYGTREVARNRNDHLSLNKIVSELIILHFFSILGFFFLYLMIVFSYQRFYQYINILLILSLNLIMSLFSLEWFYIGMEEYEYIAKRSIFIKLTAFLFMIFFIKREEDLYLYLIFLVGGISLNGIFNIYNLKKYVKFTLSNLKIIRHIKEMKYFYFQVMIGILANGLDQVILGTNSNMNEVAYYSRSRQLIGIFMIISSSFSKTILSKINNFVVYEKKKYEELLILSIKITIFFMFPLTILTFVLSKELFFIIGGYKFLFGATTLKILSLVIICSGISSWLNYQICIPMKKEKIIFQALIILVISSLFFSVLLSKNFGAKGVALGITIGEILNLVFIIYLLRKEKIKFIYFSVEIVEFIFSSIITGIIIKIIEINMKITLKNSIFILILFGSIYITFIIILDFILFNKKLFNCLKEKVNEKIFKCYKK
ncbi:oligosaccharide flippase family protein [Fusobacterium varium]|uniref:oligosaccharide flippase family protein n=1 Tax=Fusobacterium varium TaxID=856 RepID=UPI001F407866|nr:oligosaccharide flippase family protein [Fusobacterium varium]MCF2674456.1 oligosaccharide flippase family protein [Fusobacterium varium]